MNSLDDIVALTRGGRYRDALSALQSTTPNAGGRSHNEVLRATLLEQVGDADEAVRVATGLLRSRQVTGARRSQCEAVIGRLLFDRGHTDEGLGHLHRAVLLGQQASDLHAVFAAKLKLLLIVSDRSGPAAGSSILADLRQIATALGDPDVTARLHLFIAEAEAKRGLLENARRHTSLARRIIKTSPNAYLDAFTGNLELAIAVLRSEFNIAKDCGFHALKMAELSGVARLRRAVLGNMGNLFYEVGDFARATSYFETALASPSTHGPDINGLYESLARVYLAEERHEACAAALDRIEASVRVANDLRSYEHRHSALTRIQLLMSQGYFSEAITKTATLIAVAAQSGDALLLKQAELTKADLLQRTGKIAASVELLGSLLPELMGTSPSMYARHEQILACALARVDDESAMFHRDRAFRICCAIGSVPRQRELASAWDEAKQLERSPATSEATITTDDPYNLRAARSVLHSIATAFTQATRPELVAGEFLDIVAITNCANNARVTTKTVGTTEQIGPEGDVETVTHLSERRLSVGFREDREIYLSLRAKPSIEAQASINALTVLLASVHEVQRCRAEREERATLWPVEELPNGARSVISGRMRELMLYARRIAKTKVNVLITGESGTGKEILARAIHDYSDRAQKAFVPFNCTAIPRDLLESQLFGHRRGAFTGADRDQLGLIRTARDGTLFLDEIGELGLDLQPKLLRFLESGEISPLGEPGSLTIDVRIVAATNTHLEDAVRAGRFREDLFYRLNVVRLSIPPLRERRDEIPAFVNHFVARAAEEFKKGQLRVADETMERLLLYRWPGNVRQLQNELRRMVALAEPGSTLLPHAISEDILGALPLFRHTPGNGNEIAVGLHDKLEPTIARVEGEMIKAALRTHHGKVAAVAKALGISRKGLYLKRQRLGL